MASVHACQKLYMSMRACTRQHVERSFTSYHTPGDGERAGSHHGWGLGDLRRSKLSAVAALDRVRYTDFSRLGS